jgi:hypothetical protein
VNYQFTTKGLQGRFKKSAVSARDDRKGLGYGILDPSGRFEPRRSSTHYPYLDPDPYEDLDPEEEELQVMMRKKTTPPMSHDPMSHKSTDPFYFVAGNTKLSDCFYRPDDVLSEVDVASKSMSPVSSHYKGTKHGAAGGSPGAAFPYRVGNYKRTGTHYGFSHAPKLVTIFDDDVEDLTDEELEDVRKFTVRDFIDDEENYNLIKHAPARHEKVETQ